jgi:hypothetical protein
MSIDFSAAEFMKRVLDLGPDFSVYGEALGEKMTVDSAFLQNLSGRDVEMLFAFTPRAHQVLLELLLPQNASALQPVEMALPPGLAFNSDDECELPQEEIAAQVVQVGSSSFENGGGHNDSDDLFLDLDASDDDFAVAAAVKKKTKKKRRKKKTATVPSPIGKSKEEIDGIADLEKPITSAEKKKKKKKAWKKKKKMATASVQGGGGRGGE